MEKDLDALKANNTWDLIRLPAGKRPIGCKRVYKVKLKADGSLERYKACLDSKGYTQEYGVDYQETFSPLVRMTTIRTIIALASHRHWPLYQLDVNNEFFQGDLHEEVYMKPPEGLTVDPHLVCKLKKSLYGLKQASLQWFTKLHLELTHQGFTKSKNDYSLVIKRTPTSITIVAVGVDNIILTGDDWLY